jgi:hypothetical protein
MAGLNNFLSDTQQTSTTMPAWYDQAQQNIVQQGGQAMANAPSLGQTTAQGAINTLQGANNPFQQAQGTLQQISSGAANPWIVDQTTGAVTPNTGTAMGGLFAAQQQQLNQLMPDYTAPVQGAGIASGNFGSLRDQTAIQKAKGDAFAKLNASQLQAALTNQQAGVSAATGLGNVGQQGINAAMNVGQTQMNAPFNNLANYSNLISSMPVPTTTQSQVQYSPLSQIGAVSNALSGSGMPGGLSNLLFGTAESGTKGAAGYKAAGKGLFGTGGLSNVVGGAGTDLWKYVKGIGSTPGTYPLEGGGSLIMNPDGSQTIVDAAGTRQYYDASGNPTTVAQDLEDQNIIPGGDPNYGAGGDTGDYGGDYGGDTNIDYGGNYGGDYGDAP